jgi:predicted kinase
VAHFGGYDVVSFNALENFEQSRNQVGLTISREVFDRFLELTQHQLETHRLLMEERAETGFPRDTHGDLHLDHIYLFPDRDPPRDLLIVDCIEFNDRLRYADPMADLGFLVMDLLFEGRQDLSAGLADEYFRASGDEAGRALLPLYVAYRAAVRGKVEGMCAFQESIPADVREREKKRSRAHWLLGLGALEEPSRRPCAVLTVGLPATGKSTVAKLLQEHAGFEVLSSDQIRKELAGLPPTTSAKAEFEAGLYSADWTERTYAECLERTQRELFRGNRVVVDATFRGEEHRTSFLKGIRDMGAPALLIHCQADPQVVRGWIESRPGDPSDAYWEVYQRMAESWEGFGEETGRLAKSLRTEGPIQDLKDRALGVLTEAGLWGTE